MDFYQSNNFFWKWRKGNVINMFDGGSVKAFKGIFS